MRAETCPTGGPRPAEPLVGARGDAFFAEIAARHTGRSVEEELSAIAGAGARMPGQPERGRAAEGGNRGAGRRHDRREQALDQACSRIEQRFAGKLKRASELERACFGNGVCDAPSAESTGLALPVAREARSGAACGSTAGRAAKGNEKSAAGLNRNQRRVLVKYAGQQLKRIARRYLAPQDDKGGVWSREDYRRIRACVQDASGRAAGCLLYHLGSREAVTLAEELDPRVPMDRRRIAFAYAVARAPRSELGETIKLGYAMGLWSAVLADPNNPNMERRRQFRPSRRTLSSDLTWLQERGVLKRWQVRIEHAAPCEIKRNPNYPTNRYHAPIRRDGGSMMAIALALGDVPPEVSPNPSDEWTAEDAGALAEAREILFRHLGVAKLPAGPPS